MTIRALLKAGLFWIVVAAAVLGAAALTVVILDSWAEVTS